MARPRAPGPVLRAAGAFLLLSGLVASTASCNLLLGIEDVTEIPPPGGGGAGGSSAGGAGGACVPATCDSLGWACGTTPDGCGSPLDCGQCESGYACNNNEHTCVCQADSCENLLWECGSGLDHCGNELLCNDCPSPAVCVDHGCCVPDTCDTVGWQCGSGDDGCGGVFTCPDCVDPLVCSVDHVCQ